MNNLLLFNPEILNALVWTIMHSIWQFTLLALIMSILLKQYQNDSSVKRYVIASSSLALTLMFSVVTFIIYYNQSGSEIQTFILDTSNISINALSSQEFSNIFTAFTTLIERYQHPIFLTWLTGLVLFAVRFLISFGYIEFLSISAKSVQNAEVNESFDNIKTHFNVNRNLGLGESALVSSPMIMSIFKPIILFPIGIINNLNPQEIEAILAHEVAHFVRNDIYFNTIQNLIEVLFYYHPAIWWISTNIKVERENCCDDQALKYLGNNIQYAKTLVKIQELSSMRDPALALQFSKKNSFFSNRIKRILNMTQTRNYLKEKILTSMLLVALVLFFSKDMIGNHHQSELEKDRNKSFITIEKEEIKNDSLPYRRESITIQKKTDDQDVKISMENGKVTNLEIDGKKIDEKEYDKYKDIIADVKPRSKSFGNSHMYFFGDKGDDPLMLDFNNKFQLDSMMKGFGIKGFGNINYDTPEIREKMAKLKDQMGKLKFNFKGLDSINFNFEGFPDSEFDIIGDLPRMMKFYDFDGESNDTPEDMFRFKGKKDMNISDVIGNSLNRDGLLIPDQENSVELTGKYLKINGEKQPSNIWNKYKRIFEEQSGAVLQKNSNLEFKFEGKDSKIKYRVY